MRSGKLRGACVLLGLGLSLAGESKSLAQAADPCPPPVRISPGTPRPEEPSQGYWQTVHARDQFRAALWSARMSLEGSFPQKVAELGFPGGRITENGRGGAELGPGEGHDRHIIPSMKFGWISSRERSSRQRSTPRQACSGHA